MMICFDSTDLENSGYTSHMNKLLLEPIQNKKEYEDEESKKNKKEYEDEESKKEQEILTVRLRKGGRSCAALAIPVEEKRETALGETGVITLNRQAVQSKGERETEVDYATMERQLKGLDLNTRPRIGHVSEHQPFDQIL